MSDFLHNIRRYCSARKVGTGLALMVPVTVVLYFTWWFAFPIRGFGQFMERYISLLELIPVLYGTVAGNIVTSGMISWERMSASKVRWIDAVCVAVMIYTISFLPLTMYGILSVVPQELIIIDDPRRISSLGFSATMPISHVFSLVTNIMTIAAISIIATKIVGKSFGTVISMVAFIALVLLQNEPTIAPYLPFAGGYLGFSPHPVTAGILAVAAIGLSVARPRWQWKGS